MILHYKTTGNACTIHTDWPRIKRQNCSFCAFRRCFTVSCKNLENAKNMFLKVKCYSHCIPHVNSTTALEIETISMPYYTTWGYSCRHLYIYKCELKRCQTTNTEWNLCEWPNEYESRIADITVRGTETTKKQGVLKKQKVKNRKKTRGTCQMWWMNGQGLVFNKLALLWVLSNTYIHPCSLTFWIFVFSRPFSKWNCISSDKLFI